MPYLLIINTLIRTTGKNLQKHHLFCYHGNRVIRSLKNLHCFPIAVDTCTFLPNIKHFSVVLPKLEDTINCNIGFKYKGTGCHGNTF